MAKKKTFKDYTAVGSMSAKLILQNLPFVFFIGFLTTIYIANAHYAERRIREIQHLQGDVKDLKREYNSLKSDIMFKTRYSEISKTVRPSGLDREGRQPIKVMVDAGTLINE